MLYCDSDEKKCEQYSARSEWLIQEVVARWICGCENNATTVAGQY